MAKAAAPAARAAPAIFTAFVGAGPASSLVTRAISSAPTLDSTFCALVGTAVNQSGVSVKVARPSRYAWGFVEISFRMELGTAEVKAAWAAM